MLAATPLNGGHYFVDVIAGVAIAVSAIVVARQTGRVIARLEFKPGETGFAMPASIRSIVPAE
jgi:hypothetical protein